MGEPQKIKSRRYTFWIVFLYSEKRFLVNLKDIVKFVKGRQTEKFKKNKKLEEEYDNISFSLVYLVNASSQNKTKFETDSVDLTCKDSKEFDIWFNGLKACTYAIKHNYDITSLESHMLAGSLFLD